MENYTLAWSLMFRLLRALGIDPLSRMGWWTSVIYIVALFSVVPMLVTAATGQWAIAPVRIWVGAGLVFGFVGSGLYKPFQRAIDGFLCLHRTLVDEAGVRELVAWDRRWFSVRASAMAAALFAAAMLIYLRHIQLDSPGQAPLPWGTVIIGTMLLYQVGEIAYVVLMLGLESRLLRQYRYGLFHLAPSDSVALRQSIRGSNQLGLLVGVVSTLVILGFVALLSDRPVLMERVGLVLLVGAYLATGFGVVLPRLAMRSIVEAQKELAMAPLQKRLDALCADLAHLSADQFAELERLKRAHDLIRDSSEAVLPFRTVARVVTSLVLPTLTFSLTRAGGDYLARLVQSIKS